MRSLKNSVNLILLEYISVHYTVALLPTTDLKFKIMEGFKPIILI